LLGAQAAADARFELDGKALGNAARGSTWLPWPGRHTLKLLGAQGEVLDEASFEVRGAVPKAAPR